MGHRHASPAEGLQLQADGTKRLALTNNGPLGECYEPGKPVAHLALRVFEVHPGPLVAEFIAQPRVDRLHHLRVARIRFLLNVWILVLDKVLDPLLLLFLVLLIAQHQKDVVEMHEFLHGAQ